MKKLSVVVLTVLLFLCSCATNIGPTAPIGKWSYSDGLTTYNLLFSTNGTYAMEIINDNDSLNGNYTIGTFTFDDKSIYLDDSSSAIDYAITDKKLSFNGTLFERKSYKVFDLSSNLSGIWSLDGSFPTIGFASNGVFIAYETENTKSSYGQYIYSKNKLIANAKETQFLVLDNNLYLKAWDLLGNTKIMKFTKLTERGSNRSELYLTLLPEIPYTSEDSVIKYTFNTNGTYTNSLNESGTYTYNGTLVTLSDGTKLTFMVIDDIPFGYIM